MIESKNAKISADTSAHHIPSSPTISGKIKTVANLKIKVRRNEIAAEIPPLFNAVKNEEAKTLNPVIRNARDEMRSA